MCYKGWYTTAVRENTRTAQRVDGSSTSREREAGSRAEEWGSKSSKGRSRKASERGSSRAGRREGEHGRQRATAGGREARELQATRNTELVLRCADHLPRR